MQDEHDVCGDQHRFQLEHQLRRLHLGEEVQGTVDVRGCLGVDPHAQVGFTGFWSTVRLQPAADTPPRLIDKLIETTQRVCVNLDTLQRPNTIELVVDSASAG